MAHLPEAALVADLRTVALEGAPFPIQTRPDLFVDAKLLKNLQQPFPRNLPPMLGKPALGLEELQQDRKTQPASRRPVGQ